MRQVGLYEEGQKIARDRREEEVDEQYRAEQRQYRLFGLKVAQTVGHVADRKLKCKLLLGGTVVVTDQHLRDAGRHEAGSYQEKQRVYRQRRVKNARQDHSQDAFEGAFHRYIRVGLLQLVFLYDVRKQGSCRGVEDPADRVPDDAQDEQYRYVRPGLPEQEHQRSRQDYDAALDVVADVHDPGFIEAVAQNAAHRCGQQHSYAAQRQVQALNEGVVAADLKDIEAYSKAVEQCSELRYQRSQKDQPEVAACEYVAAFIRSVTHFR